MDIQDMRIFARVAAVQNLSLVGTELELTPGTISKRLQALEDDLGVRLFDRTTRSIRITEEGLAFLAWVNNSLAELDAGLAYIAERARTPKGTVRIVAPVVLGRRFLTQALCDFMRAYPDIQTKIDLKDGPISLQEDGYDVAVRVGTPSGSTLIGKRLAPDRQVIVASPSYIARRGRPMLPEDLANHTCLVLADLRQWTFGKGGSQRTVRVDGPLRSNDSELLCRAALEGVGIIRASELEVGDELSAGRLVPLLSDFEIGSNTGIWALYPGPQHVLPRLRVLLDFLGDWFRDLKGSAEASNARQVLSAGNSRHASYRVAPITSQ